MAEDPFSISTDSAYSPAALLHIFNSLLAPAQTKKIIRLKGVYRAGKGALYGGFYYDALVDETAEAQLTLIVPAQAHSLRKIRLSSFSLPDAIYP